MDLGLHILDGVRGFAVEGDGLSGERFHENLHASTESEDQMEGGLLLDVVVGKSTSILKLLSSEDESLLIWWDSFLVLDLGLDVLDSVGSFDLDADGLSGEGLHEDLHSSSETENEMKSGLLLNIVVYIVIGQTSYGLEVQIVEFLGQQSQNLITHVETQAAYANMLQ